MKSGSPKCHINRRLSHNSLNFIPVISDNMGRVRIRGGSKLSFVGI